MSAIANACIVSDDQGPVWDMEPGRPTTFKLVSGQTGGSVSVFEEIVPTGAGTPLHIHHTSDEVIHVVTGQLTIKLGIPVTIIGAGTWVFTPSDGTVLFEELRLLAQPMPSIDPETMEALRKRHGFELVSDNWE